MSDKSLRAQGLDKLYRSAKRREMRRINLQDDTQEASEQAGAIDILEAIGCSWSDIRYILKAAAVEVKAAWQEKHGLPVTA